MINISINCFLTLREIDPASKAWEAFILPMNYIRIPSLLLFLLYQKIQNCKEFFQIIFHMRSNHFGSKWSCPNRLDSPNNRDTEYSNRFYHNFPANGDDIRLFCFWFCCPISSVNMEISGFGVLRYSLRWSGRSASAMGIKDRAKTGNALDAAFTSTISWLKMQMVGSLKKTRPA